MRKDGFNMNIHNKLLIGMTGVMLFGGTIALNQNVFSQQSIIQQKEIKAIPTSCYMTDTILEKSQASILDSIELKEKYNTVYVNTILNIRKYPRIDSEVMGKYSFGDSVKVIYIDENWARVKGSNHYINRKYISEDSPSYKILSAPSSKFKSYEDYRMITAKSSRQYKLQHSLAYTGDCGIRMVNGRYCVAVGSYYTTKIGTYLDIVLKNGEVIKAILGDQKADKDTDSMNQMHPDGSAVEFIVDKYSLSGKIRKSGNVSSVNNWNSSIDYIKIYDKVEEF